MKRHFLFFSFIFFYPFFISGQTAFSVTGIIRDSVTAELLAGATVFTKSLSSGTTSDKHGRFEFSFYDNGVDCAIQVNLVGYKKKEFSVSAGRSNVIILLAKDSVEQQEVTITDTKIPQSILESPVTRMKLDAQTISQLPQENFYSGLITVKGVDVSNNSLFYQNINMRGPANPFSETVLQLTDGMDNTPPGQGFSVGNLAGENDIDIDHIDIIPGSSSAIYGANAFSGLINITSKNPFLYQGLSVQLKNGVNHLDGNNHSPALFNDFQLRYAKAWKDKIAVKLSIGYQRGTDWLNLDQTDFNASASDETKGLTNPGRDIANIYGDEVQKTLSLAMDSNVVSVPVSRTGYNANEVLGTGTNDLKIHTSLHYKLNRKTELSYLFSYSIFNTCAFPATWNFRDFSVTYHKLELKNTNYFVRLYSINDHDGHSYDAKSVAWYINNQWKGDSAWFSDYQNAYNGAVTGILANNHEASRNYADIGMPAPGSELYNKLFSESADRPGNLDGGARFEDRTNLQHLHAQYDFSSVFHWMKIISGIELRSRNLWSNGTMFLDYPPAHYINTNSIGTYVQLEKDFFQKKLNLLGSVRFDKYDGFYGSVTPRIAAMYKLNEKHFIRASYQIGSRSPDPFDQYRNSNYKNYFAVGGLALSDEKYQLHKRAFEIQSYYDFMGKTQSYIDTYGVDSTEAAIQLYKSTLKPAVLEYVHSERVQTVEIGYQCLLFDNKLHVDIDVFGSMYNDLIAYQQVALAKTGNPYKPDSLEAAATDFWADSAYGFEVPVNVSHSIHSGGIEAGLHYNVWKGYTLSGNICYQKASEMDPNINSWLFLTPPLKTNVSISNPSCYKNIGFSVNWHWTDAMGAYWSPPLSQGSINNTIHANSILDTQVTLTLPKLNSFIKFGASNLLNHYYQNVAYGASVGGVYYISILYSTK